MFFQTITSVQFSSVAQSCPTLCDPMNCSTPGLPVHHQLLEFTQTHVHWVGDAIQPSHPLSSPSPALNLSQHQGLFKWVSSSHQVAKVLEFQLQHQSFCCSHAFRETNTQKDNADSGVQFITPAGPGQSLLSAKDPGQHLGKSFIPCVRVRTHHPKFLETYINQGKYNPNNPIIRMLCAHVLKQSNN